MVKTMTQEPVERARRGPLPQPKVRPEDVTLGLHGRETLRTWLGVTDSRIPQLLKLGMPRDPGGQYDLLACLMWYMRFLQRSVQRNKSDDGTGTMRNIRDERQGLLRAQRQQKEHELAVSRREVVAISDVELTLSQMASWGTAILEGIPDKLTPRITGLTDPLQVYALLQDEIQAVMTALSKRPPAKWDDGGPGEDGGDADE